MLATAFWMHKVPHPLLYSSGNMAAGGSLVGNTIPGAQKELCMAARVPTGQVSSKLTGHVWMLQAIFTALEQLPCQQRKGRGGAGRSRGSSGVVSRSRVPEQERSQ